MAEFIKVIFDKLGIFLLIAIGIFVPGVFTIILFYFDLFIELETSKILLFAASITMPSFIFFIACQAQKYANAGNAESNEFIIGAYKCVALSLLYNFAVFGTCIATKAFLFEKMGIKTYSLMIFLGSVGFGVFLDKGESFKMSKRKDKDGKDAQTGA